MDDVTSTEIDTTIGRLVRQRRDLRQQRDMLYTDLAALGSGLTTLGRALEGFRSPAPFDHAAVTLDGLRFELRKGTDVQAGELPSPDLLSKRLAELTRVLVELREVEQQADRLHV